MNVKVTHQAWDNLSSGVPYCRRVASWTQAGSLRLPGDPSHVFALLLDLSKDVDIGYAAGSTLTICRISTRSGYSRMGCGEQQATWAIIPWLL